MPPEPLGSMVNVGPAAMSVFPLRVIEPPTTLVPVTVPVTLVLEPVITPPTVDAAVVVPVTLELEPVITPPTVLAAV